MNGNPTATGLRPVIQVKSSSSGHLHQRLEIGEIVVAELPYMGIGEAAENEVHLAHAAAPGAKERPPPARVEIVAGTRAAGHAVSPDARQGVANSRAHD